MMERAEVSSDPAPEIPGFTLLRRCGRGGSGEVWLARDADGMLRTVKFIPRRPGCEDRYEAERRAVRRYRHVAAGHPALLNILFSGETAAGRYEVSEPADNLRPPGCGYEPDTLAARLRQRKPPLREARKLFRRLLEGVAVLHRAGFAHGDLKPENLLFIRGELVIADPGSLTPLDRCVRWASPGYHPNRHCRAAEADIYALGKILYQLCGGAEPSAFPALPAERCRRRFRKCNEMMLRCCSMDGEMRLTIEELLAAFPPERSERPIRRVSAYRLLVIALLALDLLLAALPFPRSAGRSPLPHPPRREASAAPSDSTAKRLPPAETPASSAPSRPATAAARAAAPQATR